MVYRLFPEFAGFLFLWLWTVTSRSVVEVWQCEFKGNSLFCFSGWVAEEKIDTIGYFCVVLVKKNNKDK